MSRIVYDLTEEDEDEDKKGPLKRVIDHDSMLGTTNVIVVKKEPQKKPRDMQEVKDHQKGQGDTSQLYDTFTIQESEVKQETRGDVQDQQEGQIDTSTSQLDFDGIDNTVAIMLNPQIDFGMDRRREVRSDQETLVPFLNRSGNSSRLNQQELVTAQNRRIDAGEMFDSEMIQNPIMQSETMQSELAQDPTIQGETKQSEERKEFTFDGVVYHAVRCEERGSIPCKVFKLESGDKGIILVKNLFIYNVSPILRMDFVDFMNIKQAELVEEKLIPPDMKIKRVISVTTREMHVFYPSAHHGVMKTGWTPEFVKRLVSKQIGIRKRTTVNKKGDESTNVSGGNAMCPVHMVENVAYCESGDDFFFLDIFSMANRNTKLLYGSYNAISMLDPRNWTKSEQANKYFLGKNVDRYCLRDIEAKIDEMLVKPKTDSELANRMKEIADVYKVLETLDTDFGWDIMTKLRISVLLKKIADKDWEI